LTAATARSTAVSSLMRSLSRRCDGLTPMPVWMRGRAAVISASAADSMSAGTARESAHTTTASPTSAPMRRTDSKSPGLETGNPASMTSTPRRTSCLAISIFSPVFMLAPGDCSPSRNVVSNMRTVSRVMALLTSRFSCTGRPNEPTRPPRQGQTAPAA